ncbi:MAG: hypothetical protein M1833_001763 [Piccolia ochrophora]|nr:MAG: hypothetical protein M1833_001763 [Piccolia ochrophora]
MTLFIRTRQDRTAVWWLDTASAISPCRFAVRSGGHTPWKGSANIDKGVTFDLRSLNQVSVRTDSKVTSVGPGAKWSDVYSKLDTLNLAVTGGRVGSVGVGGLITGGGNSFFAPRYGLACDNIDNFEVVLATGKIVNANSKDNPDLWFALKGGSNNFGIVTRFDIRTFEQEPFWGGIVGYPIETRLEHFAAFEQLNDAASEYDPYVSVIDNYFFTLAGGWSIANNYQYTKAEAYPSVFNPFTDIRPETFNTMRISNLSDFTYDIARQANDGASRRLFVTGTYGNSPGLLEKIFDAGNATLQPVKNVKDLIWSISFQAIPASITEKAASTGGNALGLDPQEGPLVLLLMSVFWTDEADDKKINAAARDFIDRCNDEAQRMGLLNDWIYLNYAAEWQKPIQGYGPANVAKLQQASRKYDPKGVFQKNVPGGFKLFT